MRSGLLCTFLLWLMPFPASAQVEQISKGLGLGDNSGLSTEQIVGGLKDALEVGTDNTVSLTGQVDGYFQNEVIKILMPEELQKFEKGLRRAGFGDQVDDFILSMNRAAEKAAPAAKELFWQAIREMSFADAREILQGGDTAATEYFRETTSDRLTEVFYPVVKESMDEAGVTKQYKTLVGYAKNIPFLKTQDLDLDAYVVSKSLDGLFYVLGEEERKIREDPAAQVTDSLKMVFGD